MTASIIFGILIGAGVSLIWPGKADAYHVIVACAGMGVASVIWYVWSSQRSKEDDAIAQGDPQLAALMQQVEGGESLAGLAIRMLAAGLATYVLVIALGWVGSFTPLYSSFYDRDYELFVRDLHVLESAGSYEAAIEKVDERIAEPISPDKRVELAEKKYEYLLAMGREARGSEAKIRWFKGALEWANENGIYAGEADAEIRASSPTPTIQPTYTPAPTQTPQPTYTPQPTVMVPTAAPTLPPGYIDCVSAQLVDQVSPQEGELLRLYRCADEGLYKVEWLIQATSAQYSALIREGKPATFFRGTTPFRVYVDLSSGEPKIKVS